MPSSTCPSAAGSSSRRREIYGGSRSAWDYGPLGVELKENVRRQWWQTVVRGRDDVVGLDSSVILAPAGVGGVRPRRDVHRPADRVHEVPQALPRRPPDRGVRGEARPRAENGLADIDCPNCGTKGQFTEPRDFNGLLRTTSARSRTPRAVHYLRPETAQGIFVNFLNVMTAARKKPPFGIGQVGKAFRNEITPGNFIFRTREFEQMEMEFFVKPGTDEEWHEYWLQGALELVRRPRPQPRATCASSSTRRRS